MRWMQRRSVGAGRGQIQRLNLGVFKETVGKRDGSGGEIGKGERKNSAGRAKDKSSSPRIRTETPPEWLREAPGSNDR